MDLRLTKMIDEDALQQRIRELGKQITEKYQGQDLTVVCVLKGSFMFFADLIRNIDLDVTVEFFGVTSYHGHESSGEVRVTLDLNSPIENRNVLLIEDIVDTGLTMEYLKGALQARHPKSLATATLLFKPDALKKKVELEYIGFEIKNDFVVGFGLDYEGWYRNLPYIARVDNLN